MLNCVGSKKVKHHYSPLIWGDFKLTVVRVIHTIQH